MSNFNPLIGSFVKVLLKRHSKEEPIYGYLVSEDEHTIAIKFKSGECIPLGKRYIIKCLPWNKPMKSKKYDGGF